VSKAEVLRRGVLKKGEERKFGSPRRAPSQSHSPPRRRTVLKSASKKTKNLPNDQPSLETLRERVEADATVDFAKAPYYMKQRAEKRAEKLHQMMHSR
jgi:hypothetical protein